MSVPTIPNLGDWALVKAYRSPDIRQVAKITPKLVKFAGMGWPRQCGHAEIIASLPTKEAAEQLAQALAGAAGERDNRTRKARDDFDARKAAAWDAYEKVERRLVASAIEAATAAETPQAVEAKGSDHA